MVRAGVVLAIVLLVMVPALLASTSRSLQVHSSTGEFVWCVPVEPNDAVQLEFTHSMFGGYVREQWRATPNNQLQRTRFVTENAAAAEYYATDGTSFQADDGFVVPGDPLLESELIVRVNSRGNHVLTVGGQSVQLAEELPQSTQVRITVVAESCTAEN